MIARPGGTDQTDKISAVLSPAMIFLTECPLVYESRIEIPPDFFIFFVAAVKNTCILADQFLGIPAENGSDSRIGKDNGPISQADNSMRDGVQYGRHEYLLIFNVIMVFDPDMIRIGIRTAAVFHSVIPQNRE
jgi:hypothetical protein